MISTHRRLTRVLGALLGLAALAALSAPNSARATSAHLDVSAQAGDDAPACIPRDRCCKVCSKGIACGNSCISANKNCHKGRGCACDEDELCD